MNESNNQSTGWRENYWRTGWILHRRISCVSTQEAYTWLVSVIFWRHGLRRLEYLLLHWLLHHSCLPDIRTDMCNTWVKDNDNPLCVATHSCINMSVALSVCRRLQVFLRPHTPLADRNLTPHCQVWAPASAAATTWHAGLLGNQDFSLPCHPTSYHPGEISGPPESLGQLSSVILSLSKKHQSSASSPCEYTQFNSGSLQGRSLSFPCLIISVSRVPSLVSCIVISLYIYSVVSHVWIIIT